jgi:hypothetical protein
MINVVSAIGGLTVKLPSDRLRITISLITGPARGEWNDGERIF